ncbi:MAG: hypothetical protein AAFX00_13895 [Pseudomonadota bacterium]
MNVTVQPAQDIVSASELMEVREILEESNVIGFSIFDTDGNPVESEGVGETEIAVFSNIVDRSVKIGVELGETVPRPSILLSGRESELVALPLEKANLLILKQKSSGIRREYRHAG